MTRKHSAFVTAVFLAGAAFAVQGQTLPGTPGAATTGSSGDVHMSGQTEPVAKVEVAAGLKGILKSVDVKEGQLVKKGDQLAQLDDAIQKRQVELAQLDADSQNKIKEAENALDFAKNNYDRIMKVPSASDAEKREKELQVRQVELELDARKEDQKAKQVKLDQEKITLDRMTIKSPIDGAVLRINKQAGEQTDENPLVVVVQVTRLDAVFFPPKQLFGKVKVGDKVNLDFATEPPTRREAVIVAVDPIIEQGLFRVKLEVDNTDAKIPAGTTTTWTWNGK